MRKEVMLNGIEGSNKILEGLETMFLVHESLGASNEGINKLLAYFKVVKDKFSESIEDLNQKV